jgi:hypothetical protein
MNRVEALQWFVDFVNMDLDQLKRGDKEKLFVEAEECLFVTWDWHLWRVTNEDLLDVLKKELAWVNKTPPKDTAEYWGLLKKLQQELKGLFDLIEAEVANRRIWIGKMLLNLERNRAFYLGFAPLAGTHEEYIKAMFFWCLDGLPGHVIRKCPGCEKYFLNTSFRKKMFCSSTCMSRVNAAKRRDVDREAYRKYQRELMRDRYREKKGHRRLKTKSRRKGE